MKNLFLIVSFISTLSTFGQNYSLEDFIIDSLPLNEKLYKANNSKLNWLIGKKDDSIQIKENDYKTFTDGILPFSEEDVAKKLNNWSSIKVVKEVEDGFLIGLNGGEFGGGLYFLSKDGLFSYAIVPYRRIREIFDFNNKMYMIEGLAHLGSSSGSLQELSKGKKWQAENISDLPAAPGLIIEEENNVLILTSTQLMSFNRSGELKQVLEAPFYWGMLYPSSAVIQNNDIYIAMRKGILKIANFKFDPIYEWYVKK